MRRYGSLVLLSLLVSICLASIAASPARKHLPASKHLPREGRGQHRRQLEDELAGATEEAVEIFDVPRVHDTSEQVHERVADKNLTTTELIHKLRGERIEQTEQHLRSSGLRSGSSMQSSSRSSSSSSSSSAYQQLPVADTAE